MDFKEKARILVEEEILPGYRKEFGDEIFYSMFTKEKIEDLIERLAEHEKNKGTPIPIKSDVTLEFKNCSYSHLLDVLNQYDHGYDIYGPVDVKIIKKAEAYCGYIFPDSFKEYLKVFGGMNIGDSYTVGLSDKTDVKSLFWITEIIKEEHGLPEGYLCLEYDSYLGYTTCLDLKCGLGNENPTYWYLFDEKRFDGVESANFDIYFRNKIASIIKVNREDSGIQ